MLFGRSRLFIAAAVGHGLATTRLILRIYNVNSQFFEQFESGYANTWIKHVNVTGNHERPTSSFLLISDGVQCFHGDPKKPRDADFVATQDIELFPQLIEARYPFTVVFNCGE